MLVLQTGTPHLHNAGVFLVSAFLLDEEPQTCLRSVCSEVNFFLLIECCQDYVVLDGLLDCLELLFVGRGPHPCILAACQSV